MGIFNNKLFRKDTKVEEATIEDVIEQKLEEENKEEELTTETQPQSEESTPDKSKVSKPTKKKSNHKATDAKPQADTTLESEKKDADKDVSVHEASKGEPKKEKMETEEENPDGVKVEQFQAQQMSIFRGQTLRKIFQENKWWFSLGDIMSIAGIPNAAISLAYLQSKEEFSETIKNISFFDEVGKEENVICLTYEGFTLIFPILQQKGAAFHGRFPSWLKEASESSPITN